MPLVKVVCEYCNTLWEEFLYSGAVDAPACPKCNRNNQVELVKEKPGSGDVFGYHKGDK